MDPVQQMPDVIDLCTVEYNKKEWLTYYKNVWTRNLMARSIDVETDKALKAVNPEEIVQDDQGRQLPVKQRLEMRKILVQDALDLIAGIDALIAIPDDKIDSIHSKEYLKVDADMIAPAVGDACKTEDNENGRYEQTAPEKMTCVPEGKSVEDYLKEQVEKNKASEAKQ